MIPLYDVNATRRTPVVTYGLLAVNLAVFVSMALMNNIETGIFIQRFGLVPAVLTEGLLSVPRSEGGALGAIITPFTSMFIHGSGMHVAGNLLFLHVFGDNVEDVLGRGKFLLFYLGCGLGAAAMQVGVGPGSVTPMVGASGAISGVLAAYVLLYPSARVVTLTPILLLLELPAVAFVVIWFGFQLMSGLTNLGAIVAGATSGVAWFAHIGGFIAGIALMKTWLLNYRHTWLPRRRDPAWRRYRG